MTREAKVKLYNYISLKSEERTENIMLVHATLPRGLWEPGSSELCLPFWWWSQDLWYQRDRAFCCSSVKSELIRYLWNQQTHPVTGMSIPACCSLCAACCQKLLCLNAPRPSAWQKTHFSFFPAIYKGFLIPQVNPAEFQNINVVPPFPAVSVIDVFFQCSGLGDLMLDNLWSRLALP